LLLSRPSGIRHPEKTTYIRVPAAAQGLNGIFTWQKPARFKRLWLPSGKVKCCGFLQDNNRANFTTTGIEDKPGFF
jgi:hypothetical protein